MRPGDTRGSSETAAYPDAAESAEAALTMPQATADPEEGGGFTVEDTALAR
jgi:hypothetical protein